MSIARQLFREFRPLFQMLEEPFGRSAVGYGFPHHRSVFEDPFFGPANAFRPAIDVVEEGDKYVVEADLPGVKKDNVDVTIGDGGRSITIQGKTASRQTAPQSQDTSDSPSTNEGISAWSYFRATNRLTSERLWSGSSLFTRTVWLPQPIDRSKVKAKLEDGILTLQAPKLEDKETIKVAVE
ncbi:HSP20-like chaperone [Scleroderma citrinum]